MGSDGETALMYHAFMGNEDVVNLLIEHGADVKATVSRARPRRQARDPARCAVRGVGTYILPSTRRRREHRADPRVRRAPPRRREKAGSETGISPFACDFSALRAQKPYACDLGP